MRGSPILDRYVTGQFLRIFTVCVLGVPLIFIVIDLTDALDGYLREGVTGIEILFHYVYRFPYHALLAFPIASLLAAVFTVSTMTRHFETTAIKANGVSFYRMVTPLLGTAVVITGIALALTEIVPGANRRAEEVLGERRSRSETIRRNFVYRGNEGLVYAVGELDASTKRMHSVEVEREGTGFDFPTYVASAPEAIWDTSGHLWEGRSRWRMLNGRLRYFPERETTRTFRFDELWQHPFDETAERLLADPKDPDHMGYAELGRFIEAVQRSGGTARNLIVDRALKIAFPVTCFIIVLFGIPLAHTTRRGGASLSLGIALAITIFFQMLIEVARALGSGGAVPPRLAAWLPNLLFLVAGTVLMARVRT